mmetsp:Transcript_102116/g.266485  ORF Transcript_102116/g.266485 Transcript_102116/m.266485 type:complete len:301 (+) Transcript_102116:428-1330(+)
MTPLPKFLMASTRSAALRLPVSACDGMPMRLSSCKTFRTRSTLLQNTRMPVGSGSMLEVKRCKNFSFLGMSGAPFAKCSTPKGISTPSQGESSQGLRRCCSANSASSSLVAPVAEARIFCASVPSMVLSTSICKWSFRDKDVNSASTSSNTTTLSASKTSRPSSQWSRMRPGVPTTTTGLSNLRASSCFAWLLPPMSSVVFSCGKGLSRSRATLQICAASSFVGDTISTRGFASTFGSRCVGMRGSKRRARSCLASGSTCLERMGARKVRVFPEPVCADSSVSFPSRMPGTIVSCNLFGP